MFLEYWIFLKKESSILKRNYLRGLRKMRGWNMKIGRVITRIRVLIPLR